MGIFAQNGDPGDLSSVLISKKTLCIVQPKCTSGKTFKNSATVRSPLSMITLSQTVKSGGIGFMVQYVSSSYISSFF